MQSYLNYYAREKEVFDGISAGTVSESSRNTKELRNTSNFTEFSVSALNLDFLVHSI